LIGEILVSPRSIFSFINIDRLNDRTAVPQDVLHTTLSILAKALTEITSLRSDYYTLQGFMRRGDLASHWLCPLKPLLKTQLGLNPEAKLDLNKQVLAEVG
jgi:hypothetical protein